MDSGFKGRISEGVILALIPLAGYWLSFIYQMNFNGYFGIPNYMIDLNMINIIISSLGILLFGAILLQTLNVIGIFLLNINVDRRITSNITGDIVSLMLSLSLIIIFDLNILQAAILLILLPGISVIFNYIFPILTQRTIKGYLAKLLAQEDYESTTNTPLDFVARSPYRIWVLISILFVFASIISYVAGGFSARIKTDFYVAHGNIRHVIFRTYSDYYVTSPLDSLNHIGDRSIQLIPIISDSIKVKLEHIGVISKYKTKPSHVDADSAHVDRAAMSPSTQGAAQAPMTAGLKRHRVEPHSWTREQPDTN